LRLIYFALSSVWGFVAGTAAVLACVRFSGERWRLDASSLTLLTGAALLAVVGGLVTALAYHDTSKRLG
jgi:hypothetical protein